jgi:hypothetical protein
MEPEITLPEATAPSAWNRVTPLSKYLAMALFVAMPFIGGWVGYRYAPEKIIEIEKPIIIEREVEVQTANKAKAIWEEVVDVEDMRDEASLLGIISSTSLPYCMEELSLSREETVNWGPTDADGLFFKTLAPATISLIRDTQIMGYRDYVLNDTETGLDARISIIELEESIFRFGGGGNSTYRYEHNSNSVWEQEGYGEIFKQCAPRKGNFTKNGALVFRAEDGDAGAFRCWL